MNVVAIPLNVIDGIGMTYVVVKLMFLYVVPINVVPLYMSSRTTIVLAAANESAVMSTDIEPLVDVVDDMIMIK